MTTNNIKYQKYVQQHILYDSNGCAINLELYGSNKHDWNKCKWPSWNWDMFLYRIKNNILFS